MKEIRYDQDVDAMTVRLSEIKGTYFTSDEVLPGVILDYDEQEQLLAVEILDVSQHLQLEGDPNLRGIDLDSLLIQIQSGIENAVGKGVIELVRRAWEQWEAVS